MKLGRLKEVDIRELWKNEQYDFSQWLSKEENLELLDEAIGLTLTDIDTEVYVGAFRCDLVGVDDTTGIKVIIENQLESTDHDHLGKLITYASGLDAKVVVWIVKEAREEHKSAIEWLNNNTAKDISFFLIEIHAYQIGDSLPAPKFEIIEKPNDFSKNTKSGKDGELNKTQSERMNFWTQFNELVIARGKPFNLRKASTDAWYDVSLGRMGIHIDITLVNKNNNITVGIYIDNDKQLFDTLYENRADIEQELGFSLNWRRLDDKKASRVQYTIHGLDFENHANYSDFMNQSIDKVIQLRKVFKKYL